jgi:hypothetical protein
MPRTAMDQFDEPEQIERSDAESQEREQEVFGASWWGVIALSGVVAIAFGLYDGAWWSVLLLPIVLGAGAMALRVARRGGR